jgi:ADP-heptose:LPS heptosyltransferase
MLSICIVRTDLIGDVVLFLPALAALMKKYDGYRVILVVRPAVAELMQGFDGIAGIILYEDAKFRKNPIYRFRKLWEVYRRNCEITVAASYSRTVPSDLITLWSAAPIRVGWHEDGVEGWRKKGIFSAEIDRVFPENVHESVRNSALVQALGGTLGADEAPIIYVDKTAHREAEFIINSIPQRGRAIIAILPGASFPLKDWGAKKYIEEIRLLLNEKNKGPLTILICGTSGDSLPIESLNPEELSRVVQLTGKTSLPVLAALFARCALVIGNDTGTMHIAMAMKAATVCILGGGHFGRFMPYGDQRRNIFVTKPLPCFNCNWNCIFEQPLCIQEVTVEQVFEKSLGLL